MSIVCRNETLQKKVLGREGNQFRGLDDPSPSHTLQRLSEAFLLSFSVLKNVLYRKTKVCSKHLTSRYVSKIIYECKINKPLSPKVCSPSHSISSLGSLLTLPCSDVPPCTRQHRWQLAPGNLLTPCPRHDASSLSS